MSDQHRLHELQEEMAAHKLPDSVTGLPGQAQEAAHQAASRAGEQMESLGGTIREHPLAAAGIALGIGYLLGHLTT